MRIQTSRDRDFSSASPSPASTEGYTPRVNIGQHRRSVGLSACLAVALTFATSAAVAQPKPAAKSAKPSTNPAALPEQDGQAKPESADQRAGRGVVTISRAGIPIALGAVLANDGRILTALSPMGSGNDLEARFADGSTHRVKLGHHDRIWDLALLVPQTGKWSEGLTPSSLSPTRDDAEIKAFSTLLRATPAARHSGRAIHPNHVRCG
jgi:serine protease Do